MLCCVLILWILVFTLSLVSDASTSSKMVLFVNCISPHIRNTKCKVLSFWMLLSDCVLSSPTQICISNSCTFLIAKTGLLRCCLYIASLRRDDQFPFVQALMHNDTELPNAGLVAPAWEDLVVDREDEEDDMEVDPSQPDAGGNRRLLSVLTLSLWQQTCGPF